MQDKASKCVVHTGAPAVADCDICGVALCLRCAVPVRGKVLGPECLPEELRQPPAPGGAGRGSHAVFLLSGVGFAIATLASLLPWKRYGLGSGPFGAWGLTPRWSILAGIAGVIGLLIWGLVSAAGLRPGSAWRGTLRTLGGLVLLGAAMHLIRRPGFGPQSVGAWVAIVGGSLAVAGTFLKPASGNKPAGG